MNRTAIAIAAIAGIIFVIVTCCVARSDSGDPKATESPSFYGDYILLTPEPEPSTEPTDAPPSELLEEMAVKAEEEERSAPEVTEVPMRESLATYEDIELIARTIWGEAGGCDNMDHKAAVAWCILNRVDAGYGTIEEVVTAPNQFMGYIHWEDECPEEYIDLAADVVERWEWEHAGVEESGRVLPKDYLWFRAYEGHNRFRNAYDGDYNVWDFSWESPY